MNARRLEHERGEAVQESPPLGRGRQDKPGEGRPWAETVFTVILRYITERKEAAAALRASEHSARGRAEALSETRDALAKESAPDRLVDIDSQSQDPAAELLKLGGASVILATVTSGQAMSAVQGGLAVKGTLILIGVAESVQVSPLILISGSRSVKGWYSGTSIDSQDTLAFSARTGVRSMNEVFPLEHVSEASDRRMSGKTRFRVVLTMK